MSATVRFTLLGLMFGTVLSLFALVCAGAGHGSYLPFAVFGAPLSLIHPQAGLFVTPVMWALWGYVFGKSESRTWPVILLVLHLGSTCLVLLLGGGTDPLDSGWAGLQKAQQFAPGALWGGALIYVVGQAAAWRAVLRPARSAPRRAERRQHG